MAKLVAGLITCIFVIVFFWIVSGASIGSVIIGFLLLPLFCCLKG